MTFSMTGWKIERVILSLANTGIPQLTSTREVLAILVERNSHDTVGGIEGFLNTITVMDVDIDVEDPLFESEELKDAENDI
ncbi:hypothetical protein HG531_001955 [Fusarium graminearum]|nr:hypothetical protein HG531_001955 [Fusarium graminearum]